MILGAGLNTDVSDDFHYALGKSADLTLAIYVSGLMSACRLTLPSDRQVEFYTSVLEK